MDLAKVPRDSLDKAGVRLVVIGCSPHKHIEEFRHLTKFPYDVYCDPDREVYRALGLKYTASMGGRVWSPHVKSCVGMGLLNSAWRAVTSSPIQGDVLQQGGAFIINKRGEILFSHQDAGTLDHTPINDLLDKVGIPPIDFDTAGRDQ